MENDAIVTEPSDERRFLRFLPTNPLRHLKLLIVVLLHWVVVIGNFFCVFYISISGIHPVWISLVCMLTVMYFYSIDFIFESVGLSNDTI